MKRGFPSRSSRVAAGLWLATALQLLGCAALYPPVARTVDGVTTEGRFIEPNAYALYAVAALREASGKWREALELYQRALQLDSRGPEIRTRIAAVACKLRDQKRADKAFSAAFAKDEEYGPAWHELALCRRQRGDLQGALAAALRALSLDPERHETSLLAADLMERSGDIAAAWRLRDALATHAPGSRLVQRSLLQAALRTQQPARAERARRALAVLTGAGAEAVPGRGVARALWALDRGDVAEARRETELMLGADPGNADALVIALLTADLEQDHARFAELLELEPDDARAASPALLTRLQALLARRVSAQAAQRLTPQ